ncbi:hypothetical protein KSP40_PGU005251 [Platanthera guangdongensis]|uniref:Uncharacterized protein n=1 Tax=Platanthera guangdongensis TaxID=2320717 RepID=A0ABR2MVW6_9ASPA
MSSSVVPAPRVALDSHHNDLHDRIRILLEEHDLYKPMEGEDEVHWEGGGVSEGLSHLNALKPAQDSFSRRAKVANEDVDDGCIPCSCSESRQGLRLLHWTSTAAFKCYTRSICHFSAPLALEADEGDKVLDESVSTDFPIPAFGGLLMVISSYILVRMLSLAAMKMWNGAIGLGALSSHQIVSSCLESSSKWDRPTQTKCYCCLTNPYSEDSQRIFNYSLASQDYSPALVGVKRAFSTLGNDMIYSDLRGLPRTLLDNNFGVPGPSYPMMPHSVVGSSLLHYPHQPLPASYSAGAFYQTRSHAGTYQARLGVQPYTSNSLYHRCKSEYKDKLCFLSPLIPPD